MEHLMEIRKESLFTELDKIENSILKVISSFEKGILYGKRIKNDFNVRKMNTGIEEIGIFYNEFNKDCWYNKHWNNTKESSSILSICRELF